MLPRVKQGQVHDGLLELPPSFAGVNIVTLGGVSFGYRIVRRLENGGRGLTAREATGARLWRAFFLGLLAQALARADRIQDGLEVAAEAAPSSGTRANNALRRSYTASTGSC
jgi:hypothetical protein